MSIKTKKAGVGAPASFIYYTFYGTVALVQSLQPEYPKALGSAAVFLIALSLYEYVPADSPVSLCNVLFLGFVAKFPHGLTEAQLPVFLCMTKLVSLSLASVHVMFICVADTLAAAGLVGL